MEAIDDDSLYIPTPDRPVEVNYIDLPNKLCFLALPQVGKFLDMINQVRGCKTPGCSGNLAPTGVMSKGFGGCVYVSCRCDGCGSGGAYFETYMNQPGRTKDNIVSKCVQVAFIVAGSTHMGYKTLKHALGIDVVGRWIRFVICEAAKQEIKDKKEDELGSWKCAVTVADGTWQTRGWLSKNATFTIRNYLNGALLYYHHIICQRGGDDIIKEQLYKGTSKSAEGYAARITFQRAKEEGMLVSVHWQDADSSSANAVSEVFPSSSLTPLSLFLLPSSPPLLFFPHPFVFLCCG